VLIATRRLVAVPLLLVLLGGCTGSEVSPEEPAPESTGLVPAPMDDPTAAGAPEESEATEQEGAAAPTAEDEVAAGEGTPAPAADGATGAPAPADDVDELGNQVPAAGGASELALPTPVPAPSNPPAPLPSPYLAEPEDGIPDPVEATEGIPVWGVYVAFGPSPEDPAITTATQALDGAGESYVVTDVSCDDGASAALGLPADATAVAMHFQSERAAYYWVEASGAEVVGVAQVMPCEAVPAG